MPRTRPPKSPPPAAHEVMTIDDLARYLQISKSSLYKLAQDGKVPGQKVGKHWRFHKDAVDRWLTSNEHGVPIATVARSPRAQRGGAA